MIWGFVGLKMHAVAISLGKAVLEAPSKDLGSCAFQLGAYILAGLSLKSW